MIPRFEAMIPRFLSPTAFLCLLLGFPGASRAAEEWEPILQQALGAEHSQTRQDGLKQIDASTVKGLRALWKVLAIRDPNKVDWYVREGAYEALMNAKGDEAEKEIDRVLKGAEDELAREAIVYSILWRIRRAVIKEVGGNDDRKIEEAKYRLRKTRGVDYFDLVLPSIKELDPDKRLLKRIQTALGDKSTRVRRTAITGMTSYPDGSSIPLLLDNLKKLEKQKPKLYREWVLTRNGLETLTGQYFRENVEDWFRWWDIVKGQFSIEKRIEEEKGKDDDAGGKTVVVKKDGIEVKMHMKVAGPPDGYPLLVLPWGGYEVDYFRPYFHGVEEFCRVFYVRMPQVEDFKGLARDPKSNSVVYPSKTLALGLADIMKESGPDKFGVLAHGPWSGILGMMVAANNQDRVSHLVLINPRSAGAAYTHSIENVRREGLRTGNKEMSKGADGISIMEDGNPKYKPSDDAEQGGMNRALNNLEYGDPTEPETGSLGYYYRLPGGVQQTNDQSWSMKAIFAGKKTDFPVLIFMGMKSVWTPIPDMRMVSGLFKRATVAEMPESSETPFISETYLFTKHLEKFFRGAKLPKPKDSTEEKDKGKNKGKTKVGGGA